MENNNTPASEALLAQERESHKQIFDYIAMQDLEAASNELRIDLVEFMEAAQALMSPGDLSFDSEDSNSDSSRSSASSVKFLIASPLKDVPEAWKSAFTTSPNDSRNHDHSLVQSTPSISFSKLSKDIISSNFKKTDVPSPKASAIMFIRSPAESNTSSSSADASKSSAIKHFKQIGGTKEATLSPYYEARDGSKKAVLLLRTNHATPPSPSPGAGKASLVATSSDEEQGNKTSINVDIVPLKKLQMDEKEKIPAAKSADITFSSANQTSIPEDHSPPSSEGLANSPSAIPPPPRSSFQKAVTNLLPAAVTCANAASKTTVLKITNIPWTLTNAQLVRWFGSALEKSMLSLEIQIMSIHICCDRFKGRTRVPAFLEVLSSKTALKIINEKSGKLLDKREIKISIASKKELMTAIFPTWAASSFSTKERIPILSDTEIAGLKELCKLKAPFVRQTPERPFMNILSIAAKFPWKSKDTLSSQGGEQNKALQLIRDGYKLLNQYGKRIEDYDSIRSLFHQFLETHGGITGSLRTVSVSPAICATSGPLAPSNHTDANTSRSTAEDISSFSLSNSSSFASFSSPYKRALLSKPSTKREVAVEMDLPDNAPAAPPSSHVSSSGEASPKSSSLLSGSLSTNTRSGSQDSGSNTSINGEMLHKLLQNCQEQNQNIPSSQSIRKNETNPVRTADTTPYPRELKKAGDEASMLKQLTVQKPEEAITPEKNESIRGITQLNAEYEKQDMLARKQAKQKERESRQIRETVRAAAHQRQQAPNHHYHPYQYHNQYQQHQQRQSNNEALLSNPFFRDSLLSANSSSNYKQLPALPVIPETREDAYITQSDLLSLTPNDRFVYAARRAFGSNGVSNSTTANTSADKSFSPRVIEKPNVLESLFTPDAPYKHVNHPYFPPGLSLPQYTASPTHVQSGLPYGFMSQQQYSAQMQNSSGGGKLDHLASELGMNATQLRLLMHRLGNMVN